ncbi:MAG: TIGR03016 family PEP-CTERM system-associated outer membrane protein [Alphaproteobacteria bacterium]
MVPIDPRPDFDTTPEFAPPVFPSPNFGLGNFAPGTPFLPPNPAPPATPAQNPLPTTMLPPLRPGAIPAQAYDLRAPPILIRPTVSVNVGYSDNPRTTQDGFSDALARLRGDTVISIDTVRLQGQLSGGIDYLKYVRATDQDNFNARLLAYGLGTIVRDHLFIDARTAITQASRTGGIGFADPELVRRSDQTQVITTSLTPIARQSFGGYVDGELRYNYGVVRSLDGGLFGGSDTTASGTTPASTNLRNATRNEATLSLATGRLFTVFGSKVTLDAMKTESQSAARTTQLRAYDDLSYQFNQKFAGLARLGYEDIEYPLQPAASFTGPTWVVGGRYTPFPGSYLLGSYGRQEGLLGFAGSLRYEITARTVALASYQRNRASLQEQILNNLNASAVGALGNVVNQLSGLPTSLVNPQFSLNTTVSRFDTGRVGLQTRLDRDTLGVFGVYSRRSPLGTPIGTAAGTGISGEDTSFGINFSWTRSMTSRLNSSASLGYTLQTEEDQRTLTGSFRMSYLLSERLRAILIYRFIDVDSASVGNSYRRNQVEIGLTRSF